MDRAKSVEAPTPWKPKQREVIWVVGTMIVIIGALVLVPIIVRTLSTFDYEGLTFTQEKFGKIPVYHYSYYFTDTLGQQYQYNLYLRHDPRTNMIPITNRIAFKEQRTAYITLNSTALASCPTGLRDIATFARFLSDNLITVEAGNVDRELAAQNNLSHVTCETHSGNIVLAIVPSNETKIAQSRGCHTISYATCDEVLPALEKFMVQSILYAK